jgi:hypothetical protein
MDNDSPPALERPVVVVGDPVPSSHKRKRELDSDDELDLENQRINIAKTAKEIESIDARERHNTLQLLRLVQLRDARVAKLEARLNAQSTFFLARFAELQAGIAPPKPKPRKSRAPKKMKQED